MLKGINIKHWEKLRIILKGLKLEFEPRGGRIYLLTSAVSVFDKNSEDVDFVNDARAPQL